MLNAEIVVAYHGPACMDGFGAAYAAWTHFGDRATYVAVNHGRPMPRGIERAQEVYILDFSWGRPQLEWLRRKVPFVRVLDHHESMKPVLEGQPWAVFDQTRSGAMIAWNYFQPDKAPPRMIEFIQDRDIWTWKYEQARPYCRKLSQEPKDFTRWDALAKMGDAELAQYLAEGELLDHYHMGMIRRLAAGARQVELGGVKGLAVQAPSLFTSELGHLLAERSGTFGAVWQIRQPEQELRVSLRSASELNVLSIVSAMGGGGQSSAASMRLPLEALPSLL